MQLERDDKLFSMPLIGAEAVAASLLAFLASTIIAAYLADSVGFFIRPLAVFVAAFAVATAVYLRLRRRASDDAAALGAFILTVVATFGWLLWLARPDFLPTGSGPDLAHHLALLEYIQTHWRLPHDPALGAYLGEMVAYTPGSHLLAVLAGAWFRSDALHAVYSMIAATVALKAGFVFLVARRMLQQDGPPRIAFALVAVLLLFLARVHFVGSFTEQSYLAQVVSELFAVAMWWAVVVWDERPSIEAAVFFALAGVATFLTWPVWTGPLLLAFAATAVVHSELRLTTRLWHVAIAALPVGAAAALHGSRNVHGFAMVGTGGFAIWLTPEVLGWWFIGLAAAGVLFSLTSARGRGVTLLVAAIALQAAALFVTARNAGAEAPYLSLKMFYLAVHPLAVGIALLFAAAWRTTVRVLRLSPPRATALAWMVVVVVAIAVARPLAAAPRPRPVVSQAVLEAAHWAETQMPPGCIDYLVVDGYTAYWLHLAVFGHPRAWGRATDDDTFIANKGLVRWILPNGLPLAVTDNFDALPRDIRANVDVLARFGPAAVVRRRGAYHCDK